MVNLNVVVYFACQNCVNKHYIFPSDPEDFLTGQHDYIFPSDPEDFLTGQHDE